MADKKTNSARRAPRDEDAPKPKKDSGAQKALKKGGSARKPAADDEAPRGKKGSARSSARGERPQAAQPGAGENWKKGLLFSTPIIMIVLIALGVKLAMMEEPKGPQTIKIDYGAQVQECREMYRKAKTLAEAGMALEGTAGLPKLEEALKLCETSSAKIDEIREKVTALAEDPNKPKNANPNAVMNDEFDVLQPEINSLRIMCRKAILERK